MTARLLSHLIALVVACCTGAHARAQDVPPSAEASAAELHAQALDAYQALDFGRAALKLQLALQLLAAPHGNAELRARLEATLAVVYQTGTLDAAAAELQMQNAVCDDPSVAIDPLLASPDVVALLDRARRLAPVRCTPARAPAPSRTAFQDSELPPSLAHREPPPARAAPMHVRLALGAALAAGWLHAGLPTDRAEADGTCCALQLERSGLAPLLSVHAAAGLTWRDRWWFSALARMQPGAGRVALAGVLAGGRAEWIALRSLSDPWSLGLFAGATIGRTDLRASHVRAHAMAGMGGAELGASLRVALDSSIALVIAPEVDLFFPTTLLAAGITLGAEASL